MADYSKIMKEFGAYPVSITLVGIIFIIVTLPGEQRDLIKEIGLLIISFILLTVFNTLYFKWFRKK